MIKFRTYGGNASGSILRTGFGILVLIIVMAAYTGEVVAQPTPLAVERVWTQDTSGVEKTTFAPGDTIQFAARLNNPYGGMLLATNGARLGITTSPNFFSDTTNDFPPGKPVDIPAGISIWTWNATAPSEQGNYTVTVKAYDPASGTLPEGSANFTISSGSTPTPTPTSTFNISGFKINNATGSGVQGWNITLTNSTMQTNILTSADGSYKFTNLVNGTYIVNEVMEPNWTNVSPISQQVTINGADVININFTNQPPFVYVALGDSYQSGEGAGTPMSNTNDYLTKAYENGENYPQSVPQSNTYGPKVFKDRDGDACHRALENYAKVNSEKLKPYVNNKDIILIDVTCSGAKIVPGIGPNEQPPIVSISDSLSPNAPPFYCLGGIPSSTCNKDTSSQVKQALEQLKLKGLTANDVNLVTVGMGGNDARFDDIISACIKSSIYHRLLEDIGLPALLVEDLSYIFGYQTCEQADQKNLHTDREIGSLSEKETWAQNKLLETFKQARILQLNYPNILPNTYSSPFLCGGIRREDFDFLHRKLKQINSIVEQTVSSHNDERINNDERIKLVDVEDAFGENPPCPSQGALANGIDEGNFNNEVARLRNEELGPQVVQILIDYISKEYNRLVVDVQRLVDYVNDPKTQRTIRANFISPPTSGGESEDIRYDRSAGLFHPNTEGHKFLACYVRVAYGSGETCPIPVNDIPTVPVPVPTPTKTVAAQWSPPIQGIIKPDEVKTHTVFIDNTTKKADFNLFWPGSDLDLVLYTPSGVKINSSVASNDPNINYTSGATFDSYEVRLPEPGNWKMEITAVNVTSTGENYSAITFMETNLFVSIETNKESYVPNEPIAVTAYVQDNGTPLSKVNVNASISRPDGTNSTIQLYDDGLHNDNQTNDGVYANVYTDTNVSGLYYITISANGIIRNESFERKALKNVWIESYPDLTITSSDINFSNYVPIPGENITINATIHNIGDANANNASIVLYDGNPASGVLIAQDMLNVSAGQTVSASSSWNATAGQHEIYVLISPFNEFLEKNYTNNKASKIINVTSTPPMRFTTDKAIYTQGEQVIFTFINNGTDVIELPNAAPWWVENATTGERVFSPNAAQVITQLDLGKSESWTWDQNDSEGKQVQPGTYRGGINSSIGVSYTKEFEIVTATSNTSTSALKGDLNNDGKPAGAVDVNMMLQASVGDITPDQRFDLNGDGKPAGAVDVNMMLQASVGDIKLDGGS